MMRTGYGGRIGQYMAAVAVMGIFGRFERAVSVRNYGGLGLGLFIARQIVEAHGGTIHFERPADRGTCFVVDLGEDRQP